MPGDGGGGWRRRWARSLRTLLIALVVLWALFHMYRWFMPAAHRYEQRRPGPPLVAGTAGVHLPGAEIRS